MTCTECCLATDISNNALDNHGPVMPEEASRRVPTLRSIVEGRGMDIHAGCGPDDAMSCWLCGTKTGGTMREIDGRPVCADCFRQVREVAINLEAREARARK